MLLSKAACPKFDLICTLTVKSKISWYVEKGFILYSNIYLNISDKPSWKPHKPKRWFQVSWICYDVSSKAGLVIWALNICRKGWGIYSGVVLSVRDALEAALHLLKGRCTQQTFTCLGWMGCFLSFRKGVLNSTSLKFKLGLQTEKQMFSAHQVFE